MVVIFLLTFLLNPSANSQLSAPPVRILFLGDSLTEGFGVASEQAFPLIVANKLTALKKNVTVVNAGSSGSTTASGYSRLQWHMRSKPDIVVIALGANDGLRGLDLTASKANIDKMLGLTTTPKITVILAGMELPLNYGDQYRKDFAQLFVELSKKWQIDLIPFLLVGVGGVRELNLADGIHPNAKGHEKIAETVLPYLLKYL